jgi:hypothetical protein
MDGHKILRYNEEFNRVFLFDQSNQTIIEVETTPTDWLVVNRIGPLKLRDNEMDIIESILNTLCGKPQK